MAKSQQRMEVIPSKLWYYPVLVSNGLHLAEQSTTVKEQRHGEWLRKQQDTVTGEESKEMWKFFISKELTKSIQNKTFSDDGRVGRKAWKNKYWLPEWEQKKSVMRHDCLSQTYNRYEELATQGSHWHVNKRIDACRKKKEEERLVFPNLTKWMECIAKKKRQN